MHKAVRVWWRLRQAGPRRAAGAVVRRAAIKLAASPAGRRFVPADTAVTPEQLRHAIDFGPCPAGDLAARFIHHTPSSHFLDKAAETAALVRARCPEAVDRTLAVADAVCRHEFEFLGRRVEFGPSIDWFWCPETGGSWPAPPPGANQHLHFRDTRPGDIKYPWELNRHQYFVTLGKAYLHTGDEKYVRELVDQTVQWREANPLGWGHNWLSEMEIAIRIISWSNAMRLCAGSPWFRERGLEPCLTGLYEHARHLSNRLTTHWLARNNHIIGEAAGLFTFAVLFPVFPESAAWQAKALALFSREIAAQIFPDGVNQEQSTGYHRFVLDFLLLVISLGRLNGVDLPEVLWQRLEAMLEYERAVIPPDGATPFIGDCDDGRGFILSEYVPFHDYRGWQAAGAALLNRKERLGPVAQLNEEALWFLGPDRRSFFEPAAAEPKAAESTLFPDGGHAVLTAGNGADGTMVHVRCGPFGLGMHASCTHSHGDLLAPLVWWHGNPLAVDSGTYAYLCPAAERDAFRSTAAHNTLAPQGVEQAEMFPVWNWGLVPETRIEKWEATSDRTLFVGRIVSAQGFTHRRSLDLRRDPLELVIEDELDARPGLAAAAEWRMHLAPGIDATPGPQAGQILLMNEGSVRATLTTEGFDSWETVDAWHSPAYGCRIPNKCLVMTCGLSNARMRVSLR